MGRESSFTHVGDYAGQRRVEEESEKTIFFLFFQSLSSQLSERFSIKALSGLRLCQARLRRASALPRGGGKRIDIA